MLLATVVVIHRPTSEQVSDSSAGTDKGFDSSAGTDKGSDSSADTDKVVVPDTY